MLLRKCLLIAHCFSLLTFAAPINEEATHINDLAQQMRPLLGPLQSRADLVAVLGLFTVALGAAVIVITSMDRAWSKAAALVV